jgi:hypothetical protein
MPRHEEFAIDYKNDIFWVAYRYSGDEKDESVYVAGWDMEGKTGGDLYSTLRRILDAQFGRGDGDALGLMGAPFLSCDQAYIGAGIPLSLRTILEEFFTTNEIPYSDVRYRAALHKMALNKRWADALGEPLKNTREDNGYVLALTVLTKGMKANATLAS